ncbi:MAG: hypothetical protein OXF05_05400 [Hyphomicrobiales bacterium]|nr:hypothetical protein [Hyphomicrobiales bacterium]
MDDDAAATIGFAEAGSNTEEPVAANDADSFSPLEKQHAVELDLAGSALPSDFALDIGVDTAASTAGAAEYTVPSTVSLTTTSSSRVSFNVEIHSDIIADDGETLVLTIPEEQTNLPDGVNLVASKLRHEITIADTPPPMFGWENTSVFYTPNSQGGGTFTAKLVTTPRVSFPRTSQINVRPVASTGSFTSGPNQFFIRDSEHTVTYVVAGMATGTITISGPGGPTLSSHLPDGWTLANHVLTFAPATNVPTVGFASPGSEAREGTAATVDISFGNYTIPAGESISLTFNVDGTATRAGSRRDASYGGNDINNSVTVNFPAGTTNFNIDILENIVASGELDETLILTIDESNLSSLGLTLDTTYPSHTITIPANDNIVSFTSNQATVLESTGQVTLPLRLASAVAPVGGLPFTLTVADNAGNSIASDRFSVDGQGAGNLDFDILPADGTNTGVTVRFSADGDTNNEIVKFTLTERSGFPGWGMVNSSLNEFTLTITDDVGWTIGFVQEETKVFENAGTVEIELAVSGFDASLLGEINMGMSGALDDVLHDGNNTLQVTKNDGDSLTVTQGGQGENPRIVVRIKGDSDTEGQETVTFTLPSMIGLTGGTMVPASADNTHMLKIEPSNGLAWFPSGSETGTVSEGGVSTMIRVLLHGAAVAPTGGLPLKLSFDSGTDGDIVSFSDGSDSNEATFKVTEGLDFHDVTVYIKNNDMHASDRDVMFTLSADADVAGGFPAGWGQVPSSNNTYTLTVEDDDAAPTIRFMEQTSAVNEPNDNRYGTNPGGDTTREHPVTLEVSGTLAANHNLPILVSGGATAGSDFEVPSIVELTPGDSNGTVSLTVTINEDGIPEGTEEIILTIDGTNLPAGFGPSATHFSHTVTIGANDQWVGLGSRSETGQDGSADVTVDEGAGPVTLVVRLLNLGVQAPVGGVPVRLEAVSGNTGGKISFHETEQRDWTVATIPEGMNEVTASVYIKSDPEDGSDEEVRILMTEGTNFPTELAIIPQTSGLHEGVIRITDTTPSIGFEKERTETQEGETAVLALDFKNYMISSGILTLVFDITVTGDLVLGSGDNDSSLRGDVEYDDDGQVENPLIVLLDATNNANPSVDIDVLIDASETPEKAESLTLTLRCGEALPSGVVCGAITAHTIAIPADGNRAIFDSSSGMVNENDGMTTLGVSSNLAPAPSEGVPLKLTVVDTEGNPVRNELVTFTRGMVDNEHVFSIPAGKTAPEPPVTVYINDNNIDEPDQDIIFELSAGDGFPTNWGKISLSSFRYTLTVVDDDQAMIGFANPSSKTVYEQGGNLDLDIELEVTDYIVPPSPAGLSVPMVIEGSVGTVLGEVLYENDTLQEFITGGDDLTILPGTNPGDNPRFTLRIRADNRPEPGGTVTFTLPEMFTIFETTTTMLSDPNAKTYTLTIEPSDGFAFFPDNADTGSVLENAGMVTIPVSLNGVPAPSTDLPLKLEIASGNAKSHNLVSSRSDKRFATFDENRTEKKTLDFTVRAGRSSHEVTVYINDNDMDAPDQDIVFTLSKGENFPAEWGGVANKDSDNNAEREKATYTLTVEDDDDPATIEWERENVTYVVDPSGTSTFSVSIVATRSPYTTENGSLHWAASSVTGGSVTIKQGGEVASSFFLSERAEFPIHLDFEVTGPAEGTVTLTEGSPGSGGFPLTRGWALGNTVLHFRPKQSIGFAAATSSVSEPAGSGGSASVAVDMEVLNHTIDTAHRFIFDVSSDDDIQGDASYGGAPLTNANPLEVLFTGGTSFNIDINHDETREHDETITLTLRHGESDLPAGVEPGDITEHKITILANDNTVTFGEPSLSTIAEEGTATVTAAIDLTIPAGTSPSPTIIIRPSAGSGDEDARIGTDYRLLVGGTPLTNNGDDTWTWTLPAGSGTAELTIETLDTRSITTNRNFTLTFEKGALPGGWEIVPDVGGTTATRTINIENDDMPSIEFAQAASSTPEETAPYFIDFTINHSASSANVNATITASGDIGAGILASNTVPISGVSNQRWEIATIPGNEVIGDGNKTVTLELVNPPAGWKLGAQTTHTLTITDNDTGTIEFAESATLATEPETGSTNYTVNIKVVGAPPVPGSAFNLPVSLENTSTAVDPADYTVSPALNAVSVSSDHVEDGGFLPLTFSINADSTPEDVAETIELTLGDPSVQGWSLVNGSTTHVISIAANENTIAFGDLSGGTSSSTVAEEGTATIAATINLAIPAGTTPAPTITITPSEGSGDGDAVIGTDYRLSAGGTPLTVNGDGKWIWTLPEGSGTAELAIETLDTSSHIIDRSFMLTFEAGTLPEGWEIVPDDGDTTVTRTVTITNDDEGIIGFASADDLRVPEGNTATLALDFINYTIPSGGLDLKFDVTGTAERSGTNEDAQYNESSITDLLTVNLNPADTSFDIVILPNTDGSREIDETLTFTLKNGAGDLPAGVKAGSISERTIIIPASGNTVTFGNPSSSTIAEGESTTIPATINLAIPAGTTPAPTITITASGDAVKDTDYELSVPPDSSHGSLIDNGGNMWTWTLPYEADSSADTRSVELTIESMSTTEKTLMLAFEEDALPEGWDIVPDGAGTTAIRTVSFVPQPTIGFADAASEVSEGNPATVGLEFSNYTIPSGTNLNLSFDVSSDTATLTGTGHDADYNNGGGISNPLNVSIPASQSNNPSFNIATISDTSLEPDETITLTFDTNSLPAGVNPGGVTEHIITILASDNSVSFAPADRSSEVGESDTPQRTDITLTLTNPAPEGGLPLKLTATGATGLVSLADGSHTDALDFTIQPEDGTTKTITVFLRDNSDDADPDAQIVTFTLTERSDSAATFPGGWGSVDTASGADVHTLTVTDDDSGNTAFFDSSRSHHRGRATERRDTSETLKVSLFRDGAPSTGLPLKIRVTSGNENGLVFFLDSDGNESNEQVFSVAPGMKSHEVTVYIRDNSDDDPDNRHVVEFMLSKGEEFPEEWGDVDTDNDTFTLNIIDDDGPAIVGWANTDVTYTPNPDGTGTFQAQIFSLPAASGVAVIVRTSSTGGDARLRGRSTLFTFNGSSPVLNFDITGSARGTVTIREQFPSTRWKFGDNNVLNFRPAAGADGTTGPSSSPHRESSPPRTPETDFQRDALSTPR